MMDLLDQRESRACAEHSKSGCGGAFVFNEDFVPSNPGPTTLASLKLRSFSEPRLRQAGLSVHLRMTNELAGALGHLVRR